MAGEPPARSFYMQLQPDWSAAGEDESCWLDVYERSVALRGREVRASASSTQYQLPLRADASAAAVVSAALEGEREHPAHLVEVTRRDKHWIEVAAALPAGNAQLAQVRTVFQAPTDAFDLERSLSHPMNSDASVGTRSGKKRTKSSLQLYAVDVSNDERFVAIGAADGTCLLWDQQARTQMLPLAGHVADVTAVRFFPSSQVLLTGSLDFTLRIWSVTGRCAATLRGHVGGVEDVAIIGRGRNVASCGSDGLIQLWSCAAQSAIARWANDASSAVHCLSILQDTTNCLLDDDGSGGTLNDSESETEGKVLFAGLDNGEVLGVDIRTRAAALNLDGPSAVLSCAAVEASELGGPLLYTGTEDGFLTAWDLRQTSSPLRVASRSSAPIHSIAPSSTGVWTAHGDGACCHWRGMTIGEDGVNPSVSTELTGPEFDPVRGLAVAPSSGHVYTACRDGEFRTYVPHYME